MLSKQKAAIHTNAVYGFAMLLEKILKEEKPNHFLVAFDAGKTTFRKHQKYSEYKGGRQKTPPELSEQFPYIRQLLDAYHIKRYELDNYEDDIIGTLSKEADKAGFQTIIITVDRDLAQLATDNVTIYYTKGVTMFDHYTPDFIAKIQRVNT